MLLDYDRLGALRWPLGGISLAVALFLPLPILLIVALSFGSSQWLQFPPPGWTLRWYRDPAVSPPPWAGRGRRAGQPNGRGRSSRCCRCRWAAGRLGLVRGRFRAARCCAALFLTPMVPPVVVLAVALYALLPVAAPERHADRLRHRLSGQRPALRPGCRSAMRWSASTRRFEDAAGALRRQPSNSCN